MQVQPACSLRDSQYQAAHCRLPSSPAQTQVQQQDLSDVPCSCDVGSYLSLQAILQPDLASLQAPGASFPGSTRTVPACSLSEASRPPKSAEATLRSRRCGINTAQAILPE